MAILIGGLWAIAEWKTQPQWQRMIETSIVTGSLITAQGRYGVYQWEPWQKPSSHVCKLLSNAISAISSKWPTIIRVIWKSINDWTHQSIRRLSNKSISQSISHSINANFIIKLIRLSDTGIGWLNDLKYWLTDWPTDQLTDWYVPHLLAYVQLSRHTKWFMHQTHCNVM